MSFLTAAWAINYWVSYLFCGYIKDEKHQFYFYGLSAQGHLIGVTLMALAFNYFFVKTLINAKNKTYSK